MDIRVFMLFKQHCGYLPFSVASKMNAPVSYLYLMLYFQDMLPEYIPMRIAESILFAGKAVWVLRNPSPAFQFHDAPSNQHIPKASQKLQGFTHLFSSQKEPSVAMNLIGEELLPQSEADKIEAMLRDLKVLMC